MKIDYRWSVAKEGYLPILTSFFVCWLGTAFFGLSIVSIILFILFLIILYFFRDPDRIIPNEEGILSPADGKIISIEKSKDSEFTENEMTRICIFLSIFDAHIARSPIKSSVIETRYFPGEFHFANSIKAIENERLCVHLKSNLNENFVLILYAGFIARRIVSYINTSSNLERGERVGIIKFGSRVDIYVPIDYATNLKTGDNVVAGETVLFRKSD
tara:strand:+ start:2510 stop:3157 length:648 start_codon:yes stop_codon:yes gene_type:complete